MACIVCKIFVGKFVRATSVFLLSVLAFRAVIRSLILHHHNIALHYQIILFSHIAWNDFDAIPRSASTLGLTDHGGSRKRLLFSRREITRNETSEIMANSTFKKPVFPSVNFRRVNMITNPAVENS